MTKLELLDKIADAIATRQGEVMDALIDSGIKIDRNMSRSKLAYWTLKALLNPPTPPSNLKKAHVPFSKRLTALIAQNEAIKATVVDQSAEVNGENYANAVGEVSNTSAAVTQAISSMVDEFKKIKDINKKNAMGQADWLLLTAAVEQKLTKAAQMAYGGGTFAAAGPTPSTGLSANQKVAIGVTCTIVAVAIGIAIWYWWSKKQEAKFEDGGSFGTPPPPAPEPAPAPAPPPPAPEVAAPAPAPAPANPLTSPM